MKFERILIGILVCYIIFTFLKNNNIDLKKEILNILFSNKIVQDNPDKAKAKDTDENKEKDEDEESDEDEENEENEEYEEYEDNKEDTESLSTTDLENSLVFFDITLNNKFLGRIIFKLYDDIVPNTCKNFRELAISSPIENSEYPAYQNTIFHRIIKDFMIQGGDFINGDGTGNISIYGKTFDDECLDIKHDRPGLLSMANTGSNTNGSQFFITLTSLPHLDGKNVVFGEIIDGLDIIRTIEETPVDENDIPKYEVKIIKSGLYLEKSY